MILYDATYKMSFFEFGITNNFDIGIALPVYITNLEVSGTADIRFVVHTDVPGSITACWWPPRRGSLGGRTVIGPPP